MNARGVGAALGLAAMLLAASGAMAQVSIETVPVGNPGNAADTRYNNISVGAVAYEYNIGKYEVTAGQYCAFLNAVAATDTYGLYLTAMDSSSHGCQITRHGTSGNYTYDFSGRPSGTTEADWANRPVNFVFWSDAARFANWLTNGQGNGSTETGAYNLNGARTNAALMAVIMPSAAQRATWSNGANPYFLLTSEDEWYKAAYHNKTAELAATYFNYPTSSNSVPSNGLTSPDGGNNANFYQSGYTIDSPYYRTPVGEFELSDSPYGTFDQGGNVWEWNEANISGYRGLRGGAFNSYDYYLHASYRAYHPSAQSDVVGFRVSVVPEPASMAVLALGGVAVMRRRHRGCTGDQQ